MDHPVYLGEISTDDAGRLIVLGGHGKSASYDGSRAITFANNEGWHDDVSDGPVTAEVRIGGRPLEVTPAWVVVAPPDYAPQRKSVRTMWDLMRDVAIKAGTLACPPRPSFTDDILPIFHRLAGLQWVNAGFAAGFGWKGMVDLTSEQATLASVGQRTGRQRTAQGDRQPVPLFRGRLLVAGALAVAVRRCDEHPGGGNAATIRRPDRHPTQIASAMGERRLHRRPRSGRPAAAPPGGRARG